MLWFRRCVSWLLIVLLAACAHQPAPTVKLALSQTERGVMIWLPDHVLFEFGQAALSPQSTPYLTRGEHPNAFEDAFARLKRELEPALNPPQEAR